MIPRVSPGGPLPSTFPTSLSTTLPEPPLPRRQQLAQRLEHPEQGHHPEQDRHGILHQRALEVLAAGAVAEEPPQPADRRPVAERGRPAPEHRHIHDHRQLPGNLGRPEPPERREEQQDHHHKLAGDVQPLPEAPHLEVTDINLSAAPLNRIPQQPELPGAIPAPEPLKQPLGRIERRGQVEEEQQRQAQERMPDRLGKLLVTQIFRTSSVCHQDLLPA